MAYHSDPITPAIPEETGLRAHVHRVAALATRAAELQGWPAADIRATEQTSLLHHYPIELIDANPASRLLNDLGVTAAASGIPPRIASALRVFRGLTTAQDDRTDEMVRVVESANLFDEHVEGLPYDDRPEAEALEEVTACGILSPMFLSALDHFHAISKDDLRRRSRALPVFPKAAVEALRIAKDPDAGTRELEAVVSKDPVLAGEILKVVNSGMFGGEQEVSSLGAAMARIGMETASKVIAAGAVRPLFASSSLYQLWKHSVQTAEDAAHAASECPGADCAEAYLAGLVHDVGRIPFETSPGAASLRAWQHQAGFPVCYAETLVSGTTHAEIGAEILRNWNFPLGLIDAVLFHHAPERSSSKLASILHTVEDVMESLPSCARDHAAAQRLNAPEKKVLRAG